MKHIIEGYEVFTSPVCPHGATHSYEFQVWVAPFVIKGFNQANDPKALPNEWVVIWLWHGYREMGRCKTVTEAIDWIQSISHSKDEVKQVCRERESAYRKGQRQLS